MIIKCPHCSQSVEYDPQEGIFCPECGQELIAPQEEEVREQPPAIKENSDLSGRYNIQSEKLESDMERLDRRIDEADQRFMDKAEKFSARIDFMGEVRKRVKTDPEQAAAGKPAVAPDLDDCPHLSVEYNRNVYFLRESECTIKLKLTPQTDELEDIILYMETKRGDTLCRRPIEVKAHFRKGRSINLIEQFNPGDISGRMVINFYAACKIQGKFSYYSFAVEHKVYDNRQSGSSLFNQLNINQEISSHHAADINYKDSLGDALKKMSDKHLSVNEMIDKLNDLPPCYEVQYLNETTWRPEDVLVKGLHFRTEKLTLEYGDITLHLCSKKSVILGRDPDQADLLVRCGQGQLSPREYPNSTVSRKHTQILYCEDAVKLFDHSTYGTYINDRKPDSAGIILKQDAEIGFGDISWKLNIQYCDARLSHNICQTCSGHKVKSVTFKRTDEEKEYYLLIWQCCELGRLIEDLTDWTIFTKDGSFFIRTPDQDFYYLRPGSQGIQYKGIRLTVRNFNQF